MTWFSTLPSVASRWHPRFTFSNQPTITWADVNTKTLNWSKMILHVAVASSENTQRRQPGARLWGKSPPCLVSGCSDLKTQMFLHLFRARFLYLCRDNEADTFPPPHRSSLSAPLHPCWLWITLTDQQGAAQSQFKNTIPVTQWFSTLLRPSWGLLAAYLWFFLLRTFN